jgi:5-methylcytosine-specific restriction endonuclease McrA
MVLVAIKAPHKCSSPGCRNLATHGKCASCKARPKYRRVVSVNGKLTDAASVSDRIEGWKADRPEQVEAARLRNRPAYRRLRAWLLQVHPRCYNPVNRHVGHPPMAEQVHHIVPIIADADQAFDAANCVPLCRRCHAAVEAMERAASLPASTWQRWQAFIDEAAI